MIPTLRDNMLSQYLHTKGARLGIPVTVNFELTSRCNFRCPMCYVHTEDPKERELTADEWLNIAEQAKNAGSLFVLLTGGEPLLRTDFSQIYSGLKALGMVISVNTNGSLMTDDIIDLFKADMPARINVSLYGASGSTYRNMCGTNAFEQVVSSIEKLKAAGIPVKINSSFTPYNSGDIFEIQKTADRLGVPLQTAAYMFPPARRGKERPFSRLSPESAADLLMDHEIFLTGKEKIAQYTAGILSGGRYPCRTDCEAEEADGAPSVCRAGRCSAWICSNGTMTACGMMPVPCADIKELGFEGAWSRIKARTAEIRLPAECSSCTRQKLCSVCAAKCYAETGSFSQRPDYLCRMIKRCLERAAELCKEE